MPNKKIGILKKKERKQRPAGEPKVLTIGTKTRGGAGGGKLPPLLSVAVEGGWLVKSAPKEHRESGDSP